MGSVEILFFTLSVAMMVVTFWFLWRQRHYGQTNLLAPASFVMIIFTLQFGISNYAAVLFGENLFYRLAGKENLLFRTMTIALGSMILFGICYLRAFRITLRRWARRLQEGQVWVRPKLSLIILFYLIGLAARLIMIRKGVYSYLIMDRYVFAEQLGSTMILSRLERLCNFSLIALAITWCVFPKERSFRFWLAVVFIIEIFFNFLGGTKGLTLINFFYIAVIYWYIKRNFPWKWAVAAVIVWILITPWNLAYRDQINAGYVETSDFATITGALTKSFEDAFIPGPVTGPIDQFFKHLKVRVPLLQEATLVMEYADTVGYLYGEKYLLLPLIAFIPRFIWPTKPVQESGYWVTREIYGVTLGYSSTAITGIGDFYLDFGIIGPLLGFSLWGFFFGWFEARFRSSSLGILLIGGLYINLITIVGNETFGILGGIIKDLMILLPFAWATGFGLPFGRRQRRGVKPIKPEGLRYYSQRLQ